MVGFFRDLTDIVHHPYVALILLTALAFDYVNGFHDAANSIATIVGTRVLRPILSSACSHCYGSGRAPAVADNTGRCAASAIAMPRPLAMQA